MSIGRSGGHYAGTIQPKPKPVLHVAGAADPLVKYDWQRRMLDAVLKLNQAGAGVD